MTNKPHLLMVDDDKELTELLADYLETEGFKVTTAESAAVAEALLSATHAFSLMLLDIMMPGKSGLDFLRELRAHHNLPVIMLTGRGDDIDRILGLEMGADDYLAKPCNPRELLARIRAILRRVELQPSSAISNQNLLLSGILLDEGARTVTLAGELLELTGSEFNVLSVLMKHAGQVVSKESLTEQVLHRKLTAYDRAIDVHVSRVRQKLANYLPDTELIKTIRGQGYQFLQVAA